MFFFELYYIFYRLWEMSKKVYNMFKILRNLWGLLVSAAKYAYYFTTPPDHPLMYFFPCGKKGLGKVFILSLFFLFLLSGSWSRETAPTNCLRAALFSRRKRKRKEVVISQGNKNIISQTPLLCYN